MWDRAYRLRWDDVKYTPGTLEVVTYKDGKEWARDKVTTTGAPAQLAAAAETETVAADGTDICYVNVCVKDAEGRVVPNAKVPVTFSLEGPGEIVATDNGDETDFADFHQPARRTFNGWAQALVRPLPNQAGTLRLTVKAEGLSPSTVTVKATNH